MSYAVAGMPKFLTAAAAMMKFMVMVVMTPSLVVLVTTLLMVAPVRIPQCFRGTMRIM